MPADHRIHIVDDDASMLDSTRILLTALGYQALGWASPLDFLERATLAAGDCLLLDIRMPGMGGFELLGLLRARGETVPVVLVTGHCDDAIIAHAQAVGAVRLIEKPYAIVTFEEAMRALITATPAG